MSDSESSVFQGLECLGSTQVSSMMAQHLAAASSHDAKCGQHKMLRLLCWTDS